MEIFNVLELISEYRSDNMKKKGFTLVELLAVIAILAILVLIVLPQVLSMFRKSKDDTFIIEARAIMNAAEKKLSEETFNGAVVEEKIYCMSSGETQNELETTGRDIFYLIYARNNKLVSYAISDNIDHTVFNVDPENGLTANDIQELYENVIEIKDCDIDYLLSTGGVDPNTLTFEPTIGPNGELINVPYSGFTGFSCQYSGIQQTDAKYFDFNKNTKTITKYLGDSVTVVIPCKIAGVRVENIGDNAFSGKNIKSVYMPDTVKSIGTKAFYNNNITNISIGNSVTSMGCGAFANNSLEAVVFPRNLVSLGNTSCANGNGAFQNNTKLERVYFQSNNLTTIGAYTFYGTKLSVIDLSSQNKLSTIGKYAFANNRNLGAIRFSTSISSIGDYAFNGAGLRSIYISSQPGVTIGQYAFANNSLTKITLNGAKSIGANAFTNNQMPDNQAYIMNVDSSGRETGVLNSYAGASRSNLTFPDKVKDISQTSFQNMQLTGTLNVGNSVETIPNYAFANNQLTKAIIGTSVKTIGQYAFQNSGISTVQFAEGIEQINCGAFRGTKIKNIIFPDSLKRIDSSCNYGIFESANVLESVTFGKNLEYIGAYAFSSNKLKKVDLSQTKVTTIGNYAFRSNQITEILLPESGTLTSIGSQAFQSNQLSKVSLIGNNLNIGTNAFSNNKITEVEIGGSNNTFNSNVFSSNNINKLNIDGTNIKILDGVFANNKIAEFSMKGVTQLGTNAFKNNLMTGDAAFVMQPDSNGNPTDKLNSYGGANRNNIVIPDSVTQSGVTVNIREIPSNAFSSLNLTGSLTTGNNLKVIRSYAFSSNSLTSANVDAAETIESYAFANNQLTSANYSHVKSLGLNAFKNNKFPDSTAFVMNIDSNGNPTTSLNSYAGATRSNITIPNEITSINNSNFYAGSYPIYLSGTLTIGNGITTIQSQTFYGSSITSLTLGSNVETIDTQAFASCTSLSDINWNNKIKEIKWGAFYNTGLVNLTIPDSVTTIGGVTTSNYYYRYYKNGTTSYVPWSYSYNSYSPYYGAFQGNSKLKSVTLGSGITSMDPLAFYGNNNLESLNLEKATNLSTIPDFAFTNGKYTKVTIPANVQSLGDYAFDRVSTLSEIFIKGKAQMEQFDYEGTRWKGDCTNVRFEIPSCFEHSGGTVTAYNPTCSKKAKVPTQIEGTNITSIGANVFNGLNLTSVYIPKEIKNVDASAFNNATVEYIMVQGKGSENDFTSHGTNWNNNNHVIYENNQVTCLKLDNRNVLTGYYVDASICNRNVYIPKTVTGTTAEALKGYVFNSIEVEDGTRLTTYGMGDAWNGSVQAVDFKGDSYEYNCYTLSGSTITRYRDFCKQNIDLTTTNGKIQGVTITKIGPNAFKETGLQAIKFTDNITEIGERAFYGNYELSSVTFVNQINNDSSELVKIGKEAFYANDLVQINLPGALKYVGDNAFDDNIRLQKIIVLNKDALTEFDYLGDRWNGDCTEITFQRNR